MNAVGAPPKLEIHVADPPGIRGNFIQSLIDRMADVEWGRDTDGKKYAEDDQQNDQGFAGEKVKRSFCPGR
jgi:hypothetical protein